MLAGLLCLACTSEEAPGASESESEGGESGGTSETGDTGTPEPPIPFEPIECPEVEPDVARERLCVEAADPDNAPDPIFIDCATESACFGPSEPEPVSELVLGIYNMERGLELDGQLELFGGDPRVPDFDVLLISEADRGCSRSGARNVTRELAEAMAMHYVFAVEYTELPRAGEPEVAIESTCEHGNAVLSRFPLGNVEVIRHAANSDVWVGNPEQPRLGGRVAVKADVLVGDRIVHVYSLHFESGDAEDMRTAQALELLDHADALPFEVVIGGDANTLAYVIDLTQGGPIDEPTVRAFLDRGYVDTHGELPVNERATVTMFGGVIDLIFTRGAIGSAPGLCSIPDCGALSDHVPVWATISI